MHLPVLCFILLWGIDVSQSDSKGPITSSKYVEYIPGNINLLFVSGHNGYTRKSVDIPDRECGCKIGGKCQFRGSEGFPGCKNCPGKTCRVVTEGDSYTRKIAVAARERILELPGDSRPHLIISLLHRSKMDPNRAEDDATQGDPIALQAYRSYHGIIRQVKSRMSGPGLLIDFHAQAHGYNSTEVGYTIKKSALNDGSFSAEDTSIYSLVTRSSHDVKELVSGEASLGEAIERAGYKAVPSRRQPSPGRQAYFNGGFTTSTHGSKKGGQVDAIQIELPGELRRQGKQETWSDSVRTEFSRSLGDAIHEFFHQHYTQEN